MEKTMTLNLRVNPTVKQQAEDVLKQLGIPMATAIDMYLRLSWQVYHIRCREKRSAQQLTLL